MMMMFAYVHVFVIIHMRKFTNLARQLESNEVLFFTSYLYCKLHSDIVCIFFKAIKHLFIPLNIVQNNSKGVRKSEITVKLVRTCGLVCCKYME